jgi:DNA-binding MarR family transcriptional regulator
LTPRGRKLWTAVMALIGQRNNEIFGCLTPAERKDLGRLLDRLIEHARPQYP